MIYAVVIIVNDSPRAVFDTDGNIKMVLPARNLIGYYNTDLQHQVVDFKFASFFQDKQEADDIAALLKKGGYTNVYARLVPDEEMTKTFADYKPDDLDDDVVFGPHPDFTK